jgi:hypothetical protein
MTAGNTFVHGRNGRLQSSGSLAWAMIYCSSSSAVMYLHFARYDMSFPYRRSAIRRFDKAEFVDLAEAGQRGNQGRCSGLQAFLQGTYGHSGNDGRRGLRTLRVHGTNRQARMALRRRLCVNSASGIRLVHELGQLARSEEFLDSCHDRADVDKRLRRNGCPVSWMVIRSLTTRSIRVRPMRNWFCSNSPTQRRRRLPRWSISSLLAKAIHEVQQVVDVGNDVFLRNRAVFVRQITSCCR